MAIRPILILPDPRLRTRSEAIATIDGSVRALIDDMFATMYDAPGIGLAAIQIGEPRRLVVIDTAREGEDKRPHVFINPQVVWASEDRKTYQEGCLSIPEYYEDVERPARVRVRFQDEGGAAREQEFEGVMATCIQHEIDHLDGVLFIDYLSKLKRDRIVKKFAKQARRGTA